MKLDDLQRWTIEALGRNGGFSHRYIASRVLRSPAATLSKQQVAMVSSYLHHVGIKVTDWRRGLTPLARQHADKVSKIRRAKPKKRRYQRRRAA